MTHEPCFDLNTAVQMNCMFVLVLSKWVLVQAEEYCTLSVHLKLCLYSINVHLPGASLVFNFLINNFLSLAGAGVIKGCTKFQSFTNNFYVDGSTQKN